MDYIKFKICDVCKGEGQLPIGEFYVTREMAIDAGEPQLEGMPYGLEYKECLECKGEGIVYE